MDLRRASDRGAMCWVAMRLSQAWDWIDKRQVDAHVVAAIVLWATVQITRWAMHFAEHAERPGLEVAAIIAAVVGPWAALQASAIKFYFDARE